VARLLTGINRYPVKSCAPVAAQQAVVDACGLAGDRRWMLVGDDDAQLTAREHPRLLSVHVAERTDGGLDLTHPDAPALSVAPPAEDRAIPVRIWRSTVHATVAGDDAHAWFSKIAGASARLVHLHDPSQRRPNPAFSRDRDTVSLADGYPLLATTTDSLAELNRLIAKGPLAHQGPLPMRRFRPTVVISGARPWEEDGWRRLRIGDAVFRAVKGCDRCMMTTIDPDTGTHGKEPIATLARYRRWDGATWFGMHLIPDTPGARIAVGDDVEILEAVAATDGPPRG
jgi:uncharacterized protein YcbX